jgi:hypothetical protein
MAGSITQILTATGLAGASGHRAFLPPLLLGVMHRWAAATAAAGEEPFFQLSKQFQWLAAPTVIAVLAVLTIVEFIAERNPDAPEVVNLALKLPKAISGFIVAAAAVGKIDDNLVLLATSGLLGSGVSLGVDKLRADVKHAVQEPLHHATHGASDKVMGWAETAWSGFLTVMAWVIPIVAIVALGIVAGMWFARRRIEEGARVPCAKCGHRVLPGARTCPGCKADIASAATPAPSAPEKVAATVAPTASPLDPPTV